MAITLSQLIPNILRSRIVDVVGEKCYTSLVEQLDLTDVDCLKFIISKGLGIGIVVGGSVMKIPQILVILSGKSAVGLSLSTYVLETAAYAITFVYFLRNSYPFSTYGENFFLSVQNVFIILLIIHYSRPKLASRKEDKSMQLLGASALLTASLYLLYTLPSSIIQGLQMATAPLSVLSKLPQIFQNYRAQSTGQLSTFAVLSQVAGCLARIFTTTTEVSDSVALLGFLVALGLNLVLGVQMWLYWGHQVELEGNVTEKFPYELPQQFKESSFPHAQTRYQSPTANRRWARKVD